MHSSSPLQIFLIICLSTRYFLPVNIVKYMEVIYIIGIQYFFDPPETIENTPWSKD